MKNVKITVLTSKENYLKNCTTRQTSTPIIMTALGSLLFEIETFLKVGGKKLLCNVFNFMELQCCIK